MSANEACSEVCKDFKEFQSVHLFDSMIKVPNFSTTLIRTPFTFGVLVNVFSSFC